MACTETGSAFHAHRKYQAGLSGIVLRFWQTIFDRANVISIRSSNALQQFVLTALLFRPAVRLSDPSLSTAVRKMQNKRIRIDFVGL
jgi:hypothetical protein